ncbi:MAG: tyrosine-protein phosphatase [Campylobacteraceae bacterium]|jgi:protein-tyrosine phosphatase|nr:tyrosine-protein phosphatase [Campylobacteraceae bacterium]
MRKLSYINLIAAPLCALLLAGCGGSGGEKSQAANVHFSVERNKTDKAYTLNIEGDGHWQVFAGETAESIDIGTIAAQGNGSKEVNITRFPPDKRIYFQYVLNNSTKITASERLLPMQGAYNVRDVGGYKTTNGKTVKWGKVFRSGDLNQLTNADITYLENIGIKTVVDFRSESEKAAAPDTNLASVTNRLEYPINPGSAAQPAQTAEENMQALIEINKLFVTNFQSAYKNFFAALMNNQNQPLLFHCSAGKDRAGFAAALFLSSLGVDRETVIEDYLLSSIYVQEKYAPLVSTNPELLPMFTVYREYIEAAFDTIDSQYGGIDSYLTNELGVDLELMRAIYTK